MSKLPRRRVAVDRCRRYLGGVALAACTLAAPVTFANEQIQDVFVTRGAYGEVSFSDEEQPGAERVRLAVIEPAAEAVEAAARRVEQTLRVAKALEASRLAREQAREQAQAQARPPAVVPAVPVAEDRYPTYWIGRSAHPHALPRHKHRGERDDPPARQPVEPTLSAPLLRRGGAWEAEDRSSWLRAAEG
jgi:hypothetical protein